MAIITKEIWLCLELYKCAKYTFRVRRKEHKNVNKSATISCISTLVSSSENSHINCFIKYQGRKKLRRADLLPVLLDKPSQDFHLIDDMQKSRLGARQFESLFHPPQDLGNK